MNALTSPAIWGAAASAAVNPQSGQRSRRVHVQSLSSGVIAGSPGPAWSSGGGMLMPEDYAAK